MKKIISLVLLLSMLLTAAVSCGKTTTNEPVQTTEETINAAPENENKQPTIPEIIPAEQINPRKVVIDYMYKMAQVKWTPAQDMDFTQGENEIAKNLFYKKGVEYQGVIYITGSRTMTDCEEFMEQLNEKGEYTGPITKKDAWGSHCSSAIRLAYDKVEKGLKFDYTAEMVPSAKQGTLPVGDYKFEDTFKTTDEIIEANDASVIFDSYTKLQPGDCILTCWGPTGHARMILEVKIEKSAAGKVNNARSGVVCIEQTNAFDKTRKDGVNTTWYVEHFYSFSELYEAKYIPLTIATLNQTEHEDTEFTTKSVTPDSIVSEGKLKGLIRSSYCQIQSVTVEILDSSKNVVATETIRNTNKDPLVFQFNNHKASDAFTGLAAGNYTYVVTANTLYGSAKVVMTDFTV